MTLFAISSAICVTVLVATHMVLTFRSGGYMPNGESYWIRCPCGHAASWHTATGGCRKNMGGEPGADCYGYCTCPMARSEVESRGQLEEWRQ